MRDESGRPKPCAHIYKHGRLKTRKEMDEDGTLDRMAMDKMPDEIKDKSFEELANESVPITQDEIESIRRLVDGVEVDLDEPLSPDDDCNNDHSISNGLNF